MSSHLFLTGPRRATGVTTAVVESMEQNFKKDVLRELRAGKGRILLHDEVEERPGVFTIIPLWEEVSEEDIMTPRDVFNVVAQEGFKIDYGRIAIVRPFRTSRWKLTNFGGSRRTSRRLYLKHYLFSWTECVRDCRKQETLCSIVKWDEVEQLPGWWLPASYRRR